VDARAMLGMFLFARTFWSRGRACGLFCLARLNACA